MMSASMPHAIPLPYAEAGWRQWEAADMTEAWLRQYRYALVQAEMIEQLPPAIAHQRLMPYALQENEGLMPALVDLAQLPPEQLAELHVMLTEARQAGAAGPVAALLQTERSPGSIRQHLQDIQRYRHASTAAWLRVADARVWVQLPRVLGERAFHRLCSPVQRWSVCLHGVWVDTQPLPCPLPVGAARPPAESWQALLRVGAVNRALARLGYRDLATTLSTSGQLDALVRRCQQRYGISRMDDLVSYACLGAGISEQFDDHPLAQAAVAAHRALPDDQRGDGNEVDALAAMDAGHWQQIRAHFAAPVRTHQQESR